MWWYIGLASIPASLYALGNHIDKYLVEKYFKGGDIGSLVLFSSLIGIPVALVIATFAPNVLNIPAWSAFMLIANGIIFLLSIIPYFYALGYDETSVVSPLYQMTPVFAAVFGYVVLGEVLTLGQIVGGLLIMGGAIFLALEFEEKIRLKRKTFLLMLLTSILTALNVLIFKWIALEETFWVSAFWEYVGFIVFGVGVFFFHKTFRTQFLTVLKKNTAPVLLLNVFNELIVIAAKTTLHFATLFVPISMMLWLSEGLQPFFVLVFGILITLFFPHIADEKITKRHLIHKISALIVMFLGIYFLSGGFSL